MRDEVANHQAVFVEAWNAAKLDGAIPGEAYGRTQRERNDRELATFVDVLEAESRRAARRSLRGVDSSSEERVLKAFGRLATSALGWRREHLTSPTARAFREALREFPDRARRFDPALSAADIYQAARNALTMHCLQSLLDVPIESTASVLGYSLLYPYTDNLLDDPDIDSGSKIAFGRRLGDRLRGGRPTPASRREGRIFELVALIESQYSRRSFPRIFESLVDIHDAQMRSLALLAGTESPGRDTLIEIAVEKGGTSVLADGYLVAGTLSNQQAECIFGLGVLLQLRDDLEDVEADAEAGVSTVFSSQRRPGLDEPTRRALEVCAAVVARLGCFDVANAAPVRQIVTQCLPLTLTDAAASFPARYSSPFFAALEQRSPFGFAAIAKHRRRLSKSNGTLTTLLERWIGGPGEPRTRPNLGEVGTAAAMA